MSKIINDFIKSANTESGYGFFKFEKLDSNNSNQDVVDYAMKLSTSQVRQYNRYKTVPAAFISYLKSLEIIPEDLEMQKGKRTITDLTDLLFKIPYKNEITCGLGDHIREQILKDLYPDMKNMFGSGENHWRALINSKKA